MNKEMIFSILLAAGVVLSGIALLNGSLAPMSKEKIQVNPNQKTGEDQPRQVSEPEQAQEAPAVTSNNKTITKCSTNGKVIYSDKPCPKNSNISQLEIHETSGIVTPPRDVVKRTMRRMEEENRQENQGTQSSFSVIEKPNKQLCATYKADIDRYNSMARQPQSGEAQDWIREEIIRVRKLQAQANC